MGKTNTSEEENARLKRFVVDFLDRQERFKQQEAEYKKDRAEFNQTVRDFMGRNGMKKFRFKSPRGIKFSVSDIKPVKMVWLLEGLRKNLSKRVFNCVVDKTYTVNDWDGFKDYMKRLGANPRVLISYFDVKEEVNEESINRLSDEGVISAEDLKGCYELKESEGYVRVTELE